MGPLRRSWIGGYLRRRPSIQDHQGGWRKQLCIIGPSSVPDAGVGEIRLACAMGRTTRKCATVLSVNSTRRTAYPSRSHPVWTGSTGGPPQESLTGLPCHDAADRRDRTPACHTRPPSKTRQAVACTVGFLICTYGCRGRGRGWGWGGHVAFLADRDQAMAVRSGPRRFRRSPAPGRTTSQPAGDTRPRHDRLAPLPRHAKMTARPRHQRNFAPRLAGRALSSVAVGDHQARLSACADSNESRMSRRHALPSHWLGPARRGCG